MTSIKIGSPGAAAAQAVQPGKTQSRGAAAITVLRGPVPLSEPQALAKYRASKLGVPGTMRPVRDAVAAPADLARAVSLSHKRDES